MIQPRYQTNQYSFALVGNGPYVRVLGGNPRRRTIAFLPSNNTTIDFSERQRADTDSGLIRLQSSVTWQMNYGDWGPLVTGEVWLASKGINVTVNVTEITYLGR